MKFVITDSEIRYNEFPNYFLIGPKWASVIFRTTKLVNHSSLTNILNVSDVALLNPLQCLDFILIILRMFHVEEMKGVHLVFSESGPLYCDVDKLSLRRK